MWAEVALPLPLANLFTYRVPEHLCAQMQAGRQVLVPFRSHSLSGTVVRLSQEAPSLPPPKTGSAIIELKGIQCVLNPRRLVGKELLETTHWMAEKYGCSWGESLAIVYSSWGGSKKSSAGKEKAVLPPVVELEAEKSADPVPAPYALTSEQETAFAAVEQALAKGEAKTFLLFGVTSSGKTEIYLKTIQRILEAAGPAAPARQALYMVPEISLSPLFYQILKKRFGEQVGMWHSQVNSKEKSVLAEKIAGGSVRIVVGARSALFAPFQSLGAIIMDEEHDPAYKQQEKPRYHARETAIKLAQLHKAVLILGSATPSLESFYRAQQNEFTLLRLSQRVPSHSLPRLTLVASSPASKNFSPFSPEMVQAVTGTLARREQAILALNRRGYSTYLLCRACKHVWKCDGCQIPLVFHRAEEAAGAGGVLRCHYCFYQKKFPDCCEKCQSLSLFLGGIGTQKVVQELKKIFPYARILRLDGDSARKKAAYAKTYQAFQEESADILVGTQMVTQGFDFPRVTLVGIIDADTALFHPDFRAAERTFQWICQAAGRAGRSSMGGQVLVQSSLPEHYALAASCRLDFEGFYQKEIEFRKKHFFPPFSKLVLLKIESSVKKEKVEKEAERMAKLLQSLQTGEPGLRILGPNPAPREQLGKKLRWQILLKCAAEETVSQVIHLVRPHPPAAGVRVAVDVDPYELL